MRLIVSAILNSVAQEYLNAQILDIVNITKLSTVKRDSTCIISCFRWWRFSLRYDEENEIVQGFRNKTYKILQKD